MTSKDAPSLVVLAVLDGWGIDKEGPGNAVTLSNTPNVDKFRLTYPNTFLDASGEAVGLPKGEAGNTETGHLNLGAGRIIYQDLERINMAIADGTFFENKILLEVFEHAAKNKSRVHFMGLIGSGGVHSNIEHLFALIQLAHQKNFKDLFLHLFTDGRDSPPTASKTYIGKVENVIKKQAAGTIASIMGRYWAMDRDQRWDRTEKAYNALTKGEGKLVTNVLDAIDYSYSEGVTDEFIEPSVVIDKEGKPLGLIQENDSVVFFNFRIDRPRQLTKAFVFEDFSKASIDYNIGLYHRSTLSNSPKTNATDPFKRGKRLKNLFFVTMTEYGKGIIENGAHPAFPPEIVDMPVGGVFSTNGMRQLRITESEKERFVTFYFNGLREHPFPQEDRVIIPSPKVATYDKKPEMSAEELTKTLIDKINTSEYKFIVVNYPNPDMVGHTGNIEKAIIALEFVDTCVGKLASTVLAQNGCLIITADHGNVEEMINPETGEVDTEHSTNQVPFIVVRKDLIGKPRRLRTGILADVAPTILKMLGLTVPTSMTGRDLLGDLSI